MLAHFFKRICHGDKILGALYDVGNYRLASGYSSRLIKSDSLDTPHLLERRGGLEKYSVSRSDSVTYHNGNRGCKSERARTAYNENRYSSRKSKAHRFISKRKPTYNGQKRNSDNCRHEYSRHLICYLCNGSFSRRRITYHFYYLGNSRILAHAGCLAFKESRLIYGSRRNAVSHRFIDRYALTGKRGFVDSTASLNDNSVHRNVISRANYKHVAYFYIFNGHLGFFTVPYYHRRFRRKLHKAFKGVCRLSLRHSLKSFSDGYQRKYHCRRLEIELVHIAVSRRHISALHRKGHCKKSVYAIYERRARSHSHQGIHIG